MACAERASPNDRIKGMSEIAPATPEKLPGEQETFHEVNGLRLRVRTWGDDNAPSVVLLHGLRGFSGTWRGLARRLSGSFRLIAIDQRGRGESDWDPERNYYTDAYLADLVAIVDQLGLERFSLLGHSMGGTTSYVYAAQHPERLNALIIEDIAPGASVSGEGAERIRAEMAALPIDFDSWATARDYWRRARPSVSEEALEQRLAESLTVGPDGRVIWQYDARGISETRLNPSPERVVDLWPVIERIHTPTMIIRGERSDFCAVDAVEEMKRRNPCIRSLTVVGASHYVHDDAPDVFAREVSRFLNSAQRISA